MHKRVPLSWETTRGYFVDLPTYTMVAGTFLPLKKGLMHRDGAYPNAEPVDVLDLKPTVIILVPDDCPCTEDGQVDKAALAEMYRGHERFDCGDYEPPPLMDFHPVELAPPKDLSVFERIQHALNIGKVK